MIGSRALLRLTERADEAAHCLPPPLASVRSSALHGVLDLVKRPSTVRASAASVRDREQRDRDRHHCIGEIELSTGAAAGPRAGARVGNISWPELHTWLRGASFGYQTHIV